MGLEVGYVCLQSLVLFAPVEVHDGELPRLTPAQSTAGLQTQTHSSILWNGGTEIRGLG